MIVFMPENINLIIHQDVENTGLTGIFLTVENLRNKTSDVNFERFKRKTIINTYNQIRGLPDLKEDYILNGYRQLHEAVGAPNRKNLSAPETLCKILLKNHDLPQVNLLVDIYNLVSVTYRLALGAHDWDKISGNVHLRLTDGSESFTALSTTTSTQVAPGFYSYIDDSNEVICYLDVKQCEKTKITTDTKRALIIIQGNANTPFPYLEDAAREISQLLAKHCDATCHVIGQLTDFFYDYQI